MGELEGKVAFITGAGSGMGKASTKEFVRAGTHVVVADISGATQDTTMELGDFLRSDSAFYINDAVITAHGDHGIRIA